jgi:hypothetical protein
MARVVGVGPRVDQSDYPLKRIRTTRPGVP